MLSVLDIVSDPVAAEQVFSELLLTWDSITTSPSASRILGTRGFKSWKRFVGARSTITTGTWSELREGC
jgi:hypothetical protein